MKRKVQDFRKKQQIQIAKNLIGILNIQVSMVYWEILINVEKKEKS